MGPLSEESQRTSGPVVVELLDSFLGIVLYDRDTGKFSCHEKETRGLLGSGRTAVEAVYEANSAIRSTPNLREQVKRLVGTVVYKDSDSKPVEDRGV